MPNSLKRRNELAKYYEQSLKDIKEIKIPHISSNMGSSWHLYIIRIIDSKINRKKYLINYVKKILVLMFIIYRFIVNLIIKNWVTQKDYAQ